MTCSKWDIVLLPFPYTDLTAKKRRPAVVISPKTYNSGLDVILLFLTSNLKSDFKEGDYLLKQWGQAGLPKPSKIKMKIMTLDKDFIIKKIGSVQSQDALEINKVFNDFFEL